MPSNADTHTHTINIGRVWIENPSESIKIYLSIPNRNFYDQITLNMLIWLLILFSLIQILNYYL